MTIKTALHSSLVALAGGLVMIAAAGNASAQSADHLSKADANGDGSIEWQEMLDMRAAMFERLDRNDDGVADSSDSPRMGPGKKKYAEAFGKLEGADANGDGRISKSEMMEAPAPAFEYGDIDGDKVLSAEEIAALRETAEAS